MESSQQISECDLILSHEIVHNNLPLTQWGYAHDKEIVGQEKIKDFFPPRLPGHLEATQRGQEFGGVGETPMKLRTGSITWDYWVSEASLILVRFAIIL